MIEKVNSATYNLDFVDSKLNLNRKGNKTNTPAISKYNN